MPKPRHSWSGWSGLGITAWVVGGLIALPMVALIWLAVVGNGSVQTGAWAHLASTVLPRYIGNSLLLALLVGTGVAAVGVACAWVTARYDFPGKRWFEWALILPLAMPAYVIAYAYTDLLQFTGPVQSALRVALGIDGLAWRQSGYAFPEVRSLPGLALMLIFVLYPYVYLPARAAFLERAASVMEAGRLLGVTGAQAFFRLALPLARPAIAGGTLLALMEALADFGAASYFAVETFTTGIYKAWFGLRDLQAAAQLALSLLALVLLIKWVEHAARGRGHVVASGRDQSARNPAVIRLPRARAWGPMLICALPVLLGFVLPTLALLRVLIGDWADVSTHRFALTMWHSVEVAALTAVLAVTLALILAYAARQAQRNGFKTRSGQASSGNALLHLATLGYAIPGAVLAVAILIPLTRIDQWLAAALSALGLFGGSPGLILTGSLAGLIYAYLVRLIAVALTNVQSGLARVTPAMDDAARSLGASQWRTLNEVHRPMIWRSVGVAGLFVFVDALKELPATLVLRPFDFDTLATAAYTFTKDERLAEAALPCLTLVAVGLVPLIWVGRALSGHSKRAS